MARIWWHQIRHRFIVVAGSLAMLTVASGLHMKTPVANLDSPGSHHAGHDYELHRIKDRIQRRLIMPKKYLQTPRTETSKSDS
jgi:hypothetical protein